MGKVIRYLRNLAADARAGAAFFCMLRRFRADGECGQVIAQLYKATEDAG